MKKIEDLYKERFNKLIIYPEDEENIKNNIIKKYTKVKRRNKIIAYSMTFLLLCIVGFGIVYADEIKDFIQNFTIFKKTDDKGNIYTKGEVEIVKEMNYDADIPEVSLEDDKNTYSLNELEELLGMKILKSPYFKIDQVEQYLTEKVNGKIAKAKFRIYNFTDSKKEGKTGTDKYNLYFEFTTKYSPDNKIDWSTSPGIEITEYYIKKLNSNAFFFKMMDIENAAKKKLYVVNFVCDNVFYTFKFDMYGKDLNEAEQLIKDILDSLSYN